MLFENVFYLLLSAVNLSHVVGESLPESLQSILRVIVNSRRAEGEKAPAPAINMHLTTTDDNLGVLIIDGIVIDRIVYAAEDISEILVYSNIECHFRIIS